MRLQFHAAFTFDDAAAIVPYVAAMNVSHVYASPILMARKGSRHGYDGIDPTRINPELGGEEGFRRLVAALRQAGLGLIVDIVPNHMAVGGGDNPWWLDVLRHGQASRYARFFDIDWDAGGGKILAPFLGKPYGEALAAGEITLERGTDGHYAARYFHHVFPIDPATEGDIEKLPLHELLERQHYRLAWWRTANDEINWRRFFDITELAGLRVEDEDVFEATHATLFRLFGEGLIDGVRVDHVDGLTDPGDYCRRLRARLEAMRLTYLVVEKILGAGEALPAAWGCDGTTGYDFMDEVSAALHDPAGAAPLATLWASLSGRPADFAAEEDSARREILSRSFSAQLAAVAAALHRIALRDLATRDLSRAAIRRCLVEILVHFRVYRTYARPGEQSDADRKHLDRAVATARRTGLPSDRAVLDQLAAWLGGAASPDAALQALAMRRFQQLSAPLAAKAVEDTAFYRYGRLLSRSDVGFDAARFADSAETFHRNMAARRAHLPGAMLATATHDHKRGEDLRARLAVLSEIPGDWTAALERWIAASAAPEPADAAMLFQTMVGAWPPLLEPGDRDGMADFAERLVAWQEKSLREAKLRTDWTAPDEGYENAARDFIRSVLSNPLAAEIAAFARRLAPIGAVNGLAQTLIKLTAPGVPDLYQGTELWDFSLVDPDNRRPVNFHERMQSLADSPPLAELASAWRDGRIKQHLIRRTLAVRRALPGLFESGTYLPLVAEGRAARHVLAFARQGDGATAVTIVPRLASRLVAADAGLAIPASAWGDTRLRLPPGLQGRDLRIADLLGAVPVALLVATADSRTFEQVFMDRAADLVA